MDNVEKTKTELKKCNQCGKFSVSLHNGRCFECRRQEELLQSEVTKEYYRRQDKNKAIVLLSFIFGAAIIISLLCLLILVGIIPTSDDFRMTCAKGLAASISTGILSVISLLLKKLLNLKNEIGDED